MRGVALVLAAALALCAAGGSSAADATPGRCSRLPGWLTPQDPVPHAAIVNRVSVAGRDDLRWNGAPVTRAMLRQYLAIVRAMAPRPFTVVEIEEAVDCTFLQSVREDIARALPCGDGACGESFGRWDFSPAAPLAQDGVAVHPRASAEASAARAARETSRAMAEAERATRELERAADEVERAAEEALRAARNAVEPKP